MALAEVATSGRRSRKVRPGSPWRGRMTSLTRQSWALQNAKIKHVKNGRFVLIPVSDQTHGHGTHTWAAVWQQYLKERCPDNLATLTVRRSYSLSIPSGLFRAPAGRLARTFLC